nr:hypothetical protein [Tanacetum cinerariifolium]
MDFEDKKFQIVSKEGLKLEKDSKDKVTKESFKEFTKCWKETLPESVHNVKIRNRLADTPCVVVTSRHPIIKELRERVVKDPEVAKFASTCFFVQAVCSAFLERNNDDS